MTNAFTRKTAFTALLMDTSPTSPTTWPTTAMSTAWYTYCKTFTAMSGNAKESSCRNSGPSEKEIVDAEEAIGSPRKIGMRKRKPREPPRVRA